MRFAAVIFLLLSACSECKWVKTGEYKGSDVVMRVCPDDRQVIGGESGIMKVCKGDMRHKSTQLLAFMPVSFGFTY